MRKFTVLCISCLTLVIALAFTGCVWAAANGNLTARDGSGKLLGERFSIPEDTVIDFAISWNADAANRIDCVFFVRSDDSVCVSGPCWSADQSPNYGWHHGSGHGNASGNGSGYGREWRHRQYVSSDIFQPRSGDYCIIARGYCSPVSFDSNGNPIGNPIGVSNPLFMTVTSANSPDTSSDNKKGGGGCMAGFLGATLLVVFPIFMKRS